MSKKNEQGIVIGTKDEAFWMNVKKNIETEIDTYEKSLKFNKAVLKMVEEKILLEKRK